MAKLVTMDDVARHLGISKMTVSCGLRGTGRVAPKTRQRIFDACRDLGYQPNAAARAIARGRFGAVALLLSAHEGRSTLPSLLLSGIHQALADHDQHLMIAKLPDEKLTNEGFVPKILREWLADGLLINYHQAVPDEMVRIIEHHHMPSVWLNAKRDRDAVYPDDLAAGQELTKQLIELGHRRIAYHDLGWNAALRGPGARHYSQDDRYAGYRRAMREAGLTPQLIEDPEGVTPKNVVRYTVEQLLATEGPTALVTAGYEIAQRAAAVAKLRIPEDLSIASFLADPWIANEMRPTAMVVPNQELGVHSVEMLLERIEHPAEPLPAEVLPLRLKQGYSTAPPQRKHA